MATLRGLPWYFFPLLLLAIALTAIAPFVLLIGIYWWETTAVHETATYGGLEFSGYDGKIKAAEGDSKSVAKLWVNEPRLGRFQMREMPAEALAKMEELKSQKNDYDSFGIYRSQLGDRHETWIFRKPASVARTEHGEYVSFPCKMADIRRVFGKPDTYERRRGIRPGSIGH